MKVQRRGIWTGLGCQRRLLGGDKPDFERGVGVIQRKRERVF